MYKSIAILGEDVWDIRLPVGIKETKEEADRIANAIDYIKFEIVDGRYAISYILDKEKHYAFEEDVIIKVIKKEKRDMMGEPLDMRVEGNVKKAIEALENRDPAYVVEESDMIPLEGGLKALVEVYGVGYEPEHIAYGSEFVDDEV